MNTWPTGARRRPQGFDTSMSHLDMMIRMGFRSSQRTARWSTYKAGVSDNTIIHERTWHRIGWPAYTCCTKYGTRVSVALSVSSLIRDVHSPMDAWPRHADWSMVY